MRDQSTKDRQLLREFIQTRSDAAFAELVHRHVNWIYAVARRQVGESAADDLTQAVFLVLAQKAHIAVRQRLLAAWLFGVLRFAILRYRRDQKRRAHHERHAAQMHTANQTQTDQLNLELLDQLLIKLREKDRRAILVRFYEQRTLAEVAEALGISEQAAGKRVTRAVEKLRSMLALRGISTSPAILTATLMERIVAHAPSATLSAAASVTHIKSTGIAIQLSKGAMRMMAIKHASLVAVSSLAICIATAGGLAGYTHFKTATKTAAAAAASTPPQIVNVISGEHAFIAISRDKKHFSGYSNTLGKWTPLQLDSDSIAAIDHGTEAFPMVSANIAVVRITNHVYAYSPVTGTWDKIMVDIDMPPDAIWTNPDMAVVNYGDHLANFSLYTGKWAKVDWGNGKS